MKIVLLQDVKALGKKGTLVEVSEGYARNFLLPKKLGAPALLPLLPAAFDYAENICEARLLSADSLIPAAAAAGGVCTAVKTALMYLCFLLLAVFAVRAAAEKRKR